jgi:DNA primase
MEHVKVDFGKLKSIPLRAVLEKYGVMFRQPNKEYLRADCPLPSHTSKESKGSFAVNLEKNIWCCKSTSCNETARKKGGDVLDFVSIMEQTNVLSAAKKLLTWFPEVQGLPKESVKEEPKPVAKGLNEPTVNKPLNFPLKNISYHPYLKERGISEELAQMFGVGFFPGKGIMAGRVVFPILDDGAVCVAYAGRAIGGEEPRYKLPPGFHKAWVLYNLHRVKGDAVTVVEGFISAMKVTEAGFPCVALMGSTMSEEQEKLLRTFKYLTLMLDPDDAGRAGTKDILPRLAAKHYVRIARNLKPPDEMSVEEIQNTLRWVCPI